MSHSLRSMLLFVLRVLVIAFLALDPALTLAGRHSDPYVPLWFKCAWAVAAIIAVALGQGKGERLVIRYVPPALQLLIVAAIVAAALPDVLRRGYMAVLVGMVYWDGLARVWSWLAKAIQSRQRNA